VLLAHLPIFNPNYVGARVAGNLSVSFYDAEAGSTEIKAHVPPRALPYDGLDVSVDASNLPRKYTQVVYSHCFNWPRKLSVHCRGNGTKAVARVSMSPTCQRLHLPGDTVGPCLNNLPLPI
jgi:hypothetical protein